MIWKFTLRHLMTRPFSAFMTLMAVSISLSLLGGFWTVVENLERMRLSSVSSATSSSDGVAGITVFLDSKLKAQDIEAFKKEVLTNQRFTAATVVPAEEAMNALKSQFGETLSKAFEQEQLPTTLKLQFGSGTMSRGEFLGLLNEIRSKPGVLDIDEGLNLLMSPPHSMSDRVFSWATGLLLLVFVIVALLVSHLIRLAFESIRGEIETLKILGASRFRIFAPLFLEGLIFGVAGSFISNVVVVLFFKYFVPSNAIFALPSSFEVSALSWGSALSLTGLGIFAAVAGALLTWPLIDQPAQEL